MSSMLSTEIIILSKTPYKETSLILNGLSPEYGKLGFLVKGAKRVSKKKFPVIDLFRVVQINFRDTGKNLFNIYSAELVANYDNIANNYLVFTRFCELSRFLLKNSKIMLKSPLVFEAIQRALMNSTKSETCVPWCDLVQLVYLEEHGLLPERICPQSFDDESNFRQELLLSQVLDAIKGDAPPPNFTKEYWVKFGNWINELCRFYNLT